MIKNGHFSEQRDEAGRSKPGASGCNPEKRKRVVRVWCDGW